ncbi:MAG: bifunctional diaminohydroxyphosphoribosylaminopyrimidine deaminase/5-amino-6-(5-phosphoribosylamino)uracil reductase RibD [Candidatus Omnitrophica bacterium]|nr:bifunctional diaminohydroxyphosphoribosylaminopyrimidine deaminase/5-amino-6-(5-phosphoribosylamino)uracil reductase RibD [Candidatus Omnitrophota bacterium]
MRLALRLAGRALGRTSPNPAVGAVVVKGGRVIGQGYHRRAGLPHAEVEALRRAGARARGSTLYVTLEPCNHTGRTPPCCDAILTAGVSRVVIAAKDPNPITNGRGLARLRRSGVRVVAGVLEQEARRLNEPFWKAMRSRMPLVIAKVGQSLDGKIATARGESRWITSPAARRLAHQWRSRVDAILVGVNTVLRDDPRLTARGVPRRLDRPLKVIVDSRLRIPLRAKCLSAQPHAPTLIATTVRAGRKRASLRRRGAEVLTLPPRRGRVPLRRLCRQLARRGVQSVLIEGGGEVLASAFAERLVDRIVFFIAPLLIGGRQAPGSLGGVGARRLSQAVRLADITYRRAGPDLCVEARVVYPRH